MLVLSSWDLVAVLRATELVAYIDQKAYVHKQYTLKLWPTNVKKIRWLLSFISIGQLKWIQIAAYFTMFLRKSSSANLQWHLKPEQKYFLTSFKIFYVLNTKPNQNWGIGMCFQYCQKLVELKPLMALLNSLNTFAKVIDWWYRTRELLRSKCFCLRSSFSSDSCSKESSKWRAQDENGYW